MIYEVYAIKDVKADVFSNPFISANDETIMRTISDVLRNPEHPYAKHPGDYILYRVGAFDDHSGMIGSEEAVYSLCVLSDLVVKE